MPGQVGTENGHQVSVGASNVQVDGNTYALPPVAPSDAAPLTVGGIGVQGAPSGGSAIIGSSTYAPGFQTTSDGHIISVATGSVVVDGSTQVLPTPGLASAMAVGSQTVQAASSGQGVVIGGTTIAPGTQTTVNGQVVSVDSSHIVINGVTNPLPAATGDSSSPVLVGGSSISRASGGGIVIGSSTLAAGAQATVNSQTISVGANNVVVNGQTDALASTAGAVLSTGSPATPAVIGGSSIQRASNGGVIIGSSTLAPGAQATINGQTISVGSTAVVINGQTDALASTAGAVAISSSIGSSPKSVVTLPGGQVLSAGGGPVTISGQVVSILSNDQAAVVGGTTYSFASPTQSVFTAGGQVFTASPSGFVIAGTTVAPNGPAATIFGTVVSLAPSGLVIGSSTIPLTGSPASQTGLGGFIISAFDGLSTPTATAGPSGRNSTSSPLAYSPGPTLSSAPGGKGASAKSASAPRPRGEVWILSMALTFCMGLGAVAVML